MDRLVKIALRIITALILVATVVSFSESYHGLFEWAVSHQVPWFWALVWPLMLDTVILVGECAVFVAIHKHWKLRHRAWAWAVTYTGLAVSTLANGGHVSSTDRLTHLTNALPPVALMFALTVGLGVLKRTRMMPSESLSPPLTETPSQPLTQFVRTSPERSHTGSQPWIENGLPGLSRTLPPLRLSLNLRALSLRPSHRLSLGPLRLSLKAPRWPFLRVSIPLRPSPRRTSG